MLSIIYLVIFAFTTSPLFNYQVGDATIFRMLGVLANKGMIPYVEFFDHKGPFIILIEYIGACISSNTIGLMIVEIPFTFFSFLGLYRILGLFSDGRKQTILFVVSLLIYDIYNSSNVTEEYCLPFLIWSSYFATIYLLGRVNVHKISWSFLYGITIMVCVMTRITNVIPLAGLLLVGMVILIKKKDNFLKNFFSIILGMILFATPFIVYFIIHHALYDMIYATLIYNFKYVANMGYNFKILAVAKILIRKLFLVLVVTIIGTYNVIKRKNTELSIAIIISAVLAVVLQLTSNLSFTQYLTVQVPIIVISIGMLMNIGECKSMYYIITVLSASVIILGNVLQISDVVKVRNNDVSYKFENEIHDIILKIEDKDSRNIIAYNVQSYFYIVSDVKPCYKYCILQDWQTKMDPQMQEEFNCEVKSLKAEYIIESLDGGRLDGYINEHYEEIYRTESVRLLRLAN